MKQGDFKIAVFAGDGIGPEIMKEALKILKIISDKKNIDLQLTEGLVGGCDYDHFEVPLPDSSMELALQSDAVLLGAVGGPRWESLDYKVRPERALLGLRSGLVYLLICGRLLLLTSFWKRHRSRKISCRELIL